MPESDAEAGAGGKVRPGFTEFIALCALLMAMTALSIDIMLPALPEIGRALNVVDPNDRQLVVTTYMLGFAVGQLAYGPLSDSFGRKPMLMIGLVLFAAASLVATMAGSFSTLLLARAAQGLGTAAPRVIALAVVRDLFGGRDMARVMSFVMMIFIIAPVLAPGLGEIILFFGDWSWIFAFLFAVGLATILWSSTRLPETRPPDAREPLSIAWLGTAIWETVSTRQTLGYTAATGMIFGALLGYINSAQQVFVDIYDSGSLFAVFFGIVAAALALASFANGRLVANFGMRRMSHTALLGFIVTAAIHLALAAFFAGPPPLWLFCALLSLNLFFFGIAMPNFNAMAMEPLGRIAGTASSFVGAFTTASAAVFGWYIGQRFDGTVVPLLTGYIVLGGMAIATVAVTERGRLFQPQHQEIGSGGP